MKEAPDFRFYALYDKVYRRDALAYAYERCKANGGAAGVDNQIFEDIEQYGAERWLDELAQELKYGYRCALSPSVRGLTPSMSKLKCLLLCTAWSIAYHCLRWIKSQESAIRRGTRFFRASDQEESGQSRLRLSVHGLRRQGLGFGGRGEVG